MNSGIFGLLAACVATALPAACSAQDTEPKPNFVLIVADDLGYADVGFNGCEEIPTPNIDRIADEGVRFGAGYVTAAVCGPSRAGFITGRHQDRFGCSINPTPDPSVPNGIPEDEHNIAQLLKPAGYTSMAVGKWHLGTHPDEHPRDRGFDEFYGFLTGGHDYFPENLTLEDLSEVRERWSWYRTKLLHNGKRVATDDYLTDELSDMAVDFVERRAGEGPFFLYLAYNAPHTPMQATEEYLARFAHIEDGRRRTYAAMVSSMDDGIGRMLDALDAEGVADNTLVVFLSDNGGARNNASENTPLRGHKSDPFEGGIRVPFAMRWPGVLPADADYPHPVSSLDLAATFTASAGVEVRESHPLDGVDLRPHLTGEDPAPPHDVLFWRWYTRGSWAARDASGKVIEQRNGRLVFEIASDIGEQNNLESSREGEGIAQRLEALYEIWVQPMIPPIRPGLGSWNPRGPERDDE